MRTLIVLAAGGWLVAGAATSHAQVNCAQVNKYLQTGRSVQDVAETMVIDEEEVKKCQAQAQQGGAAGGAAAPAGEGGAAAPAPETGQQ